MIIGGVGYFGTLIILLLIIGAVALPFYLLYVIVKKAVKSGNKEMLEQLKKEK